MWSVSEVHYRESPGGEECFSQWGALLCMHLGIYVHLYQRFFINWPFATERAWEESCWYCTVHVATATEEFNFLQQFVCISTFSLALVFMLSCECADKYDQSQWGPFMNYTHASCCSFKYYMYIFALGTIISPNLTNCNMIYNMHVLCISCVYAVYLKFLPFSISAIGRGQTLSPELCKMQPMW